MVDSQSQFVLHLQVPPALRLAPGGMLVQEGSSKPVVLRGINWFGWSVGSFNFDGLWVGPYASLANAFVGPGPSNCI
jgi:hypothetical protein